MNVLLTGGAGYVGQHVAALLAVSGHKPIVFDSLARETPLPRGDALFVSGSVTDRAELAEVCRAYAVGVVFHLAATTVSAAAGDDLDPAQTYRDNVLGTLSVLDAMRDVGAKRLVFASTGGVYARTDSPHEGGAPRWVTEAHGVLPRDLEGETKLAAERAIASYGHAYGLSYVTLRLTTAIGESPAERGAIFSRDPFFSDLASVARGRMSRVSIPRSASSHGDGSPLFECIDVRDVAAAHVAALDYLNAGGPSGVFNVGSEIAASALEWCQAVAHAAGRPVQTEWSTTAKDRSLGTGVLAAARARDLLGWTPAHSTRERLVRLLGG
jgi:nucleoside-diphosphate-sugar epimerase